MKSNRRLSELSWREHCWKSPSRYSGGASSPLWLIRLVTGFALCNFLGAAMTRSQSNRPAWVDFRMRNSQPKLPRLLVRLIPTAATIEMEEVNHECCSVDRSSAACADFSICRRHEAGDAHRGVDGADADARPVNAAHWRR